MAIVLCPVPAIVLADTVGLDATVYSNTLTLENKDFSSVPYIVISGGPGATLLYNSSGPEFEWSLEATGLLVDGAYSLIYYADMPDRFVDWGGDNPGALIADVVASGGVISASGITDLGMNLPCYPDANISEYYYGTITTVSGYTGDNYATGYGAKIWLVPSSDYTEPALTAWNPVNYLFETDLISYTDTNAVVSITVNPTAIDFGDVVAGTTVGPEWVNVENTGTVPVIVTATVPGAGLFSNLQLNTANPSAYSVSISSGSFDDVGLTLVIPGGFAPGPVNGTLTFIATPAS